VFSSVLVANRGEIAVRVIRTLKALGIRSIAVYSDADAGAPHTLLADEAIRIGPGPAAESYLSIERVLEAAQGAGAEAIHPGYGFLSENPAFARACARARIVFVGPPPEAMERLGDKVSAKLLAQEAGVPVLDGLERRDLTDLEIEAFAASDGRLPLMIKAAAGGGGRGMRIVRSLAELSDALAAARREATAGFGDDTLLVERYVERARHIEVQILGDCHGNVVHLGERECSLQRRHQKVVEESPSPAVSATLRARLGAAATALAQRAGYVGAGTAEFLVSADDPDEFFFLEVNARLQVEHPVTEAVTGVDLVEEQLRIAAGQPIDPWRHDVRLRGHAIEVRVCAEDPASGFLPATGRVIGYREPSGDGVRVDSGIALGSEVGASYDSLLLKVIATGPDRETALERLSHALSDLRILGVTTNTGYLARLLAAPAVVAGDLDTGLLERGVAEVDPPAREAREAAIAAAVVEDLSADRPASDPWDALKGWRITGTRPVEWELERAGTKELVAVEILGTSVSVGDQTHKLAASDAGGGVLRVTLDGRTRMWEHAVDGADRWVAAGADAFAFRVAEPVVEGAAGAAHGALEAPMPGTVLSVRTTAGAAVEEGEVLVVMESMKMELTLIAPTAATVGGVHVSEGQGVRQGQPLIELEALDV
jgi:acetyl-CoA/propionyl-CoA carboxylase, biotin carboxylase, biotin carboxyl carrier protein